MTSDQGLRHSQNIEHHTCTEQWNMNLIVSTEKNIRELTGTALQIMVNQFQELEFGMYFSGMLKPLDLQTEKESVRSVAGPLLFF